MSTNSPLRFTITSTGSGKSAESYLLETACLSPRSALKRAFREGFVILNGKKADRADTLYAGDRLEVLSNAVFRAEDAIVHPNRSLSFEEIAVNADLIVANKPSGRAAHPLRPAELDTELNALAAHYPETAVAVPTGKPLEGGLVHRIDRGTSGLLVCARNAGAWTNLRAAWRGRAVEKVYLAWLDTKRGRLPAPERAPGARDNYKEGCLEMHLYHDPKSRKRMCASWNEPTGQASWSAQTSYRVLHTTDASTLVMVRIHTGVMHQIRATFAALGAPVIGDEVYAKTRPIALNQMPIPLMAMDMRTKNLFSELESTLPTFKPPQIEGLPAHGFFLHAYALRAPGFAGLDPLVVAPPPGYFF